MDSLFPAPHSLVAAKAMAFAFLLREAILLSSLTHHLLHCKPGGEAEALSCLTLAHASVLLSQYS